MQVYTSARVAALLNNFQLDADLNLIFLRRVESIEVYERPRGAAEPTLRYRVQVIIARNLSSCLRYARKPIAVPVCKLSVCLKLFRRSSFLECALQPKIAKNQ